MRSKTTAIILATFMFTGMAAADTPDIPAPGITPDSPLYALEKASERLELAVAQAPIIGSEQLEAKVRANHAAETLAEARAMAEKNNTEQVEKLMNRYSENMNRSMESAGSTNQTELKQRLRNITDNQNRALEELDDRVPEKARKGIQKAMENNRQNQEKLSGVPAGNTPGSEDRASGKPEQGTDNAPGEGSAPITGRSTSPENLGSGATGGEQPDTGEQKTPSASPTDQSNGGERTEKSSPDSDTAGYQTGAPDDPGSGGRP